MKLTFIQEPQNRLTILLFLCLCTFLNSSCVQQTRSTQPFYDQSRTHTSNVARPPININNATRKELESLPGIGGGLAERIIEYRENYGRFRRVEDLIMVRGISDRRFRELQSFVVAE